VSTTGGTEGPDGENRQCGQDYHAENIAGVFIVCCLCRPLSVFKRSLFRGEPLSPDLFQEIIGAALLTLQIV
jgi:hypothetical protein